MPGNSVSLSTAAPRNCGTLRHRATASIKGSLRSKRPSQSRPQTPMRDWFSTILFILFAFYSCPIGHTVNLSQPVQSDFYSELCNSNSGLRSCNFVFLLFLYDELWYWPLLWLALKIISLFLNNFQREYYDLHFSKRKVIPIAWK